MDAINCTYILQDEVATLTTKNGNSANLSATTAINENFGKLPVTARSDGNSIHLIGAYPLQMEILDNEMKALQGKTF